MKHLLIPSILSIAALAAPASSQKTGSTNTKAPTVTQSVHFPANDVKIDLTYTSITWAGGGWMKGLQDPERGEQARQRIATLAEKVPLGKFTTSSDITIGSSTIKAGSYKLGFKMDDKLKWHVVLTPDSGTPTDLTLELANSKHQLTRLTLSIVPGKKDSEAELFVGFGDMSCSLPISTDGVPADAKGEKKGGDEMGKGKVEAPKEKK